MPKRERRHSSFLLDALMVVEMDVLTDIYDRTKDVKLVQSAAGHTTAE